MSVALHGRSWGRIWVDAETYDVVRMNDRLVECTIQIDGNFLPLSMRTDERIQISHQRHKIHFRHMQLDRLGEIEKRLDDAVESGELASNHGDRVDIIGYAAAGELRF